MKGFGRHARCHYCPALATTRDHIVPRSIMRGFWNMKDEFLPVPNIVPACRSCNVVKSSARSTCDCDECMAAWRAYGPEGWRSKPRVNPMVGYAPLRVGHRSPLTHAIGESFRSIEWRLP